ncbi:MAG: hypothetical protein U5J78_00955 [Parasphingorhabdus sp.]|nr:hypothetical protein [Parasphingorhabdus sp.]
MLFITGAAFVLALIALALIGLRGWRDWLALKHAELVHHEARNPTSAASRIEVADLKERVRQLEAIAAGVDI